MASMKKEDAKRAVLSEYDRWAKKHPNDARMMGGFMFFQYLQDEKSDLLDFSCGWRREVANCSQLASGSVGRLGSRFRARQKALCHALKVEGVNRQFLGQSTRCGFGSAARHCKKNNQSGHHHDDSLIPPYDDL